MINGSNPSLNERLTYLDTLQSVKLILAEFWLPPHTMRDRIISVVAEETGEVPEQVIVTGETKNITLYIEDQRSILVFNPFQSTQKNYLLQEVYGESKTLDDTELVILETTPNLLNRLKLPVVLLVNPCVIENFPVPRLSLSIGLLASYLRKFQKAEVYIVDMQVGYTIEDVVQKVQQLKPALFGMSISYGQKQLGLRILNRVAGLRVKGIANPLMVLGNIVPASFTKEFIDIYPDLIVAYAEGELTIVGLIDYLRGESRIENVPGIAYRNSEGHDVRTPNISVPIDTIPLPALDTIEDLARSKGAITLEISRGCQWGACTICPREHKSRVWKTFSPEQIVEQFYQLKTVCERFNITKHIFLADEEFVGGMNDGLETERLVRMAKALIADNSPMKFDAAARVDQVFSPKMDESWHAKRLEMWHLCHLAGMDRLFLGIESGSNSQLQRYGKGILAEHSIIAIRLLSALGIPLRFGFITFDPLMIGSDELKENIAFLERRDAFMRKIDIAQYGYGKLFDLLINDKDFVLEHAANRPVYSGVSYMLATLEVLIHSRYIILLTNAEKRYNTKLLLDKDSPDTNMGRYKVAFVDDLIADISIGCQKWIDRHFGLAYCVKSLYKVASSEEKQIFMNWMVDYRGISLALLKALVYVFDAEDITDMSRDEWMTGDTRLLLEVSTIKATFKLGLPRSIVIENVINIFDVLVEDRNNELETLLVTGKVKDSQDQMLLRSLERWKKNKGIWHLIN